MEPTSAILSAVSIANMIVLGILMYIFGKMYTKTKAQLPLGMIVVTGMLFLHNIIGATAYFSMEELFSQEIFPYMLGVGIAELAGLLIFLKITLDQIGGCRLKLSIYVDGSGGADSGYGYFVKETGESSYEKKPNITNNQAEYLAIITALKKFAGTDDELTIYSDSKNTVSQLNHEFAINNEQLRTLAQESWSLIAKFSKIELKWIPRNQNLAGKMLGS